MEIKRRVLNKAQSEQASVGGGGHENNSTPPLEDECLPFPPPPQKKRTSAVTHTHIHSPCIHAPLSLSLSLSPPALSAILDSAIIAIITQDWVRRHSSSVSIDCYSLLPLAVCAPHLAWALELV